MSKGITCAVLFLLSLTSTQVCLAASKVKIRGYVTSRPDAETLQILDDVTFIYLRQRALICKTPRLRVQNR